MDNSSTTANDVASFRNEDNDNNNQNDGGSSAAITNINNDNETFFDYSNLENDDDIMSDSSDDDDDDDLNNVTGSNGRNANVDEDPSNGNYNSNNGESKTTEPIHRQQEQQPQQRRRRQHRQTHQNDETQDGSENAEDASTVLDRYMQMMDWSGALRRIKSHPNECRTIDTTTGQTPLHVACNNAAPAVVIQSLCQTYPQASIRTDRCNMNPLHILCSSSSNNNFSHISLHSVRALLNHGGTEQISMRDVDGDTPLHAACRCGADKDIIELLIQTYPPALTLHDSEGLTPLVRLWVRYYVLLGESRIQYATIHPTTVYNTDERFRSAWDITELLLRCAHYGTTTITPSTSNLSLNQSSPTSQRLIPTSIYTTSKSLQQQLSKSCNQSNSLSVLHAAAAIDCPRFVVQIAAKKYEEYLFVRDVHGRTPLMIACAAPIYPYHNLSDDSDDFDDEDDNDEMLDITNIRNNETSNVNDDHPNDNVVRETQIVASSSVAIAPTASLPTSTRSTTPNERISGAPPVCNREDTVIQILLDASIQTATSSIAPLNKTDSPASAGEQQDRMMIIKYGGAHICDPSGRLPIHIAIESGKSWYDGIDSLVRCYPESLAITDKATKLYPYQIAAVVTKVSTAQAQQHPVGINNGSFHNHQHSGNTATNNNHHVDKITLCYNLLRFNPVILSIGNTIANVTTSVSATPPNTSDFVTTRNTNSTEDVSATTTESVTIVSFGSDKNRNDDNFEHETRLSSSDGGEGDRTDDHISKKRKT